MRFWDFFSQITCFSHFFNFTFDPTELQTMDYFHIPILIQGDNLLFVLRCFDFLENFIEKENGFRITREVRQSNKKDEQPVIHNATETNMEMILLYLGIIPDKLVEELKNLAGHDIPYPALRKRTPFVVLRALKGDKPYWSYENDKTNLETIFTELTGEKLWTSQ